MPLFIVAHVLQPNTVFRLSDCHSISILASDPKPRARALSLSCAIIAALLVVQISAWGAAANVPISFSALPMQFEPNVGQTAQEVKFVSRGPGYTLFLTSTQAVLSMRIGNRPGKSSPHHNTDRSNQPHEKSQKSA